MIQKTHKDKYIEIADGTNIYQVEVYNNFNAFTMSGASASDYTQGSMVIDDASHKPYMVIDLGSGLEFVEFLTSGTYYHNSLAGLEGGNGTDEYYHLSSDAWDAIADNGNGDDYHYHSDIFYSGVTSRMQMKDGYIEISFSGALRGLLNTDFIYGLNAAKSYTTGDETKAIYDSTLSSLYGGKVSSVLWDSNIGENVFFWGDNCIVKSNNGIAVGKNVIVDSATSGGVTDTQSGGIGDTLYARGKYNFIHGKGWVATEESEYVHALSNSSAFTRNRIYLETTTTSTTANTDFIYLHGSTLDPLQVDTNKTVAVTLKVLGQNDTNDEHYYAEIKGVVHRHGSSFVLVGTGSPDENVIVRTDSDWSATFTANTFGINIAVTGDADNNIKWNIIIESQEIAY